MEENNVLVHVVMIVSIAVAKGMATFRYTSSKAWGGPYHTSTLKAAGQMSTRKFQFCHGILFPDDAYFGSRELDKFAPTDILCDVSGRFDKHTICWLGAVQMLQLSCSAIILKGFRLFW